MAFADPQTQRASSSSSSSSSSISTGGWNYDVFLRFRGEDTRHNFTDHLYRALTRKGIRTFRDAEELRRGEEIAPELLKAIEESRICLIILSQNYAHSRWCLEELVKIMEWRQSMGQLVFPIFYHVDPFDVRRQAGSYEQAFERHERNAERIQMWSLVLREVVNINGWHLQNEPEAHVIEKIASTIRKSLNGDLLHVEKNLVGMYRRRASSSSTSIGPWDYEVFFSFMGEDTSHNFTDHLYAALNEKGIRTFRVDDHKGEEIGSCISKAIEKSRCLVIILSEHYAHSSWCLGELMEIIECRRNQNGKLVILIFYHVEPYNVRKQMGSYEEEFAYHKSRNISSYITHSWRAALTEVANLSGWHVENG